MSVTYVRPFWVQFLSDSLNKPTDLWHQYTYKLSTGGFICLNLCILYFLRFYVLGKNTSAAACGCLFVSQKDQKPENQKTTIACVFVPTNVIKVTLIAVS